MTPALDPAHGALLMAIAFLAGVGITAIGPGGIFLTIALLAFGHLPPAGVAGTSSAAMVAAGLAGTLVYLRSGELTLEPNRRLAVILSSSGLVGALIGSWLNAFVSPRGLSVPALVVLGVPIVSAVAVAQAQSFPIAVFATAGYAARNAVQWSWVAAAGLPLLLGVVTG